MDSTTFRSLRKQQDRADDDINQWIYREEPNTSIIKYLQEVYPCALELVEKYDYQGGGLGVGEHGRLQPIETLVQPRNLGLGYDKNRKGPTTSTRTLNNFISYNNFFDDILEGEAIILSYNDVDLPSLFDSTSVFTINLSIHYHELIDCDL